VSFTGTASHTAALNSGELPPLVTRAVRLAQGLGFAHSCRLEQGRLLHALASGAPARIGETGTGCGVGLAWLAGAAAPHVQIVSVERDQSRADGAARLFGDHPNVRVEHDDWTALAAHAPFDLLVLDGGGSGKGGDEPIDPEAWLAPGGTLVIDDFTPSDSRPPRTPEGDVDRPRLHWLEHPALHAIEVCLAVDLAAIIAVRPRS
jgi:predicted O-methyltransferase YrrM